MAPILRSLLLRALQPLDRLHGSGGTSLFNQGTLEVLNAFLMPEFAQPAPARHPSAGSPGRQRRHQPLHQLPHHVRLVDAGQPPALLLPSLRGARPGV